MIELVALGSLVLLGLHFLTRKKPDPVQPRAVRSKPTTKKPRPEASDDGHWEFDITYQDDDGVEHQDRIAQVRHENADGEMLIHCYCERSGGQITLNNNRIVACRNLRSGRMIKNLGRYCQTRSAKR